MVTDDGVRSFGEFLEWVCVGNRKNDSTIAGFRCSKTTDGSRRIQHIAVEHSLKRSRRLPSNEKMGKRTTWTRTTSIAKLSIFAVLSSRSRTGNQPRNQANKLYTSRTLLSGSTCCANFRYRTGYDPMAPCVSPTTDFNIRCSPRSAFSTYKTAESGRMYRLDP